MASAVTSVANQRESGSEVISACSAVASGALQIADVAQAAGHAPDALDRARRPSSSRAAHALGCHETRDSALGQVGGQARRRSRRGTPRLRTPQVARTASAIRSRRRQPGVLERLRRTGPACRRPDDQAGGASSHSKCSRISARDQRRAPAAGRRRLLGDDEAVRAARRSRAIVSMSSGTSVRGSITSTDDRPRAARTLGGLHRRGGASAGSRRASRRRRRARPSARPSGTRPRRRSASSPFALNRCLCSKTSTGSGSSIAARSSP